jgi:hypothetical protein
MMTQYKGISFPWNYCLIGKIGKGEQFSLFFLIKI